MGVAGVLNSEKRQQPRDPTFARRAFEAGVGARVAITRVAANEIAESATANMSIVSVMACFFRAVG